MRRIKVIEHISLDGIIQAPGGPREDPDYPHGGWTVPFADPSLQKAIIAEHARPFDLLLGRRTYDIWADYWPKARSGPIADTFNAATKYVATHRPESLQWSPAQPLTGDLVERVRNIKSTDGPDLILWGSSTLTPILLEHALADEVLLLIYPVLLGTGKRFFSGPVAPRELALLSTTSASSGVLINTYRPIGKLRTGAFNPPTA